MVDDVEDMDTGPQAMDNTAHISLKVLGEHQHVGCVIGKQGSTIAEVQQASEAKIQISGPSDVFPGTTERIIHLSGEMLKVLSALHMVLSRWKSEAIFADVPDVGEEQVQLRMCMLGKLCGAVIGEGGKNINDIKSATNTDIRVQGRDECARGVNERVITIVGEENHVLQAVGRILKVCMADPAYEDYRQQPFTTTATQGLQNLRLLPNDPLADVPCHFTMQLTNEQAGAVLGVKGSNITSIIKMSNAKLSIQSRAEVAEGGLRNLDIQGQLDSCTTALGMVMSKLRDTGRAREMRRSTSSM